MSFEAALRAAGLRPRDVMPDGRIRRCPTDDKPRKRNGWYVLHPDGRGVYGDWSTGSSEPLGKWPEDGAAPRPASPEVLARLQAQRERDRAYRRQALRSAWGYWQASRPLNRLHPYIKAKGLTPLGCAGLRANDGHLVVPVMLGERLISVQSISLAGEKRFWPGAPVKAGAFVLRRPRAAVTCFVEGLATGLAVYQSVPQASVVVAFDAGNLLPVIERLRPSGSVVICADNDHGTLARRGVNPGLEAARNAAERIDCGVAWPEGIEGSDFADALKEWGAPAARRIERQVLAAARFVMT